MMCNIGNNAMTKNETKAALIFRMLNQDNKDRLFEWVRLAYKAESSIRALYGFDTPVNGAVRGDTQESSC